MVSPKSKEITEIRSPLDWIFSECEAFDKRNVESPQELSFFLGILMQNILGSDDSSILGCGFGKTIDSNTKIVQPIDVDTIRYKVNNGEYESLWEFLTDFKLVNHNAAITVSEFLPLNNILSKLLNFHYS